MRKVSCFVFFFHQNRVHNLVLSLCNYWKGVVVLPSNSSLHTQMRPLRISLLLPFFFFFFSSTDHYKLEYKWYLIGVLLKLFALLAENIYILSDYYSIYRQHLTLVSKSQIYLIFQDLDFETNGFLPASYWLVTLSDQALIGKRFQTLIPLR